MFGDNLKNLRIASNITQKELAKMLNVSYKSISHWESNYSELSFSLLTKLKRILKCSYEDLLE